MGSHVRFIKLISIFLIFSNYLFGSILFEKESIVITDIDLITYQNFNIDSNNKKNNNYQLIKEIYLIKKTINKLKKNNPLFIEAVDNAINANSKSIEDFNLDLIRYTYIRNDFIKDYYQNKLILEDLTEAIKNTTNIRIPLSDNRCNTISLMLDIKDIKNFDSTYFKKIKNPNSEFNYELNSKKYEMCLNQSIIVNIEYELVKVISKKTENNFKNFIYEK